MSENTIEREAARTRLILNLLANEFAIKNSGSFLMEEVFLAMEGFFLALMDKSFWSAKVNTDHLDHPSSFHTENMIQKVFTISSSYSISEEFKEAFRNLINIFFDCTITLHNDLLRTKGRSVSKGLTGQLLEIKRYLGMGLDPETPIEKSNPIRIKFDKKEFSVKDEKGDLVPVKFNKHRYTFPVSSPEDVIEIKVVKTSRGTKTKVIDSVPRPKPVSFNRTPLVSPSKLFDKLTTIGRGLSGQSKRVRKNVISFVDAAGFPICKTELRNED